MRRSLGALAAGWAACNGFLLAAPRGAAPIRRVAATGRRGEDGGGGDWDLELFSPAKVNLFLRVMGRRDDGFHELASLFQAVSLGDALMFEVLGNGATADALECDDPDCPTDASNLVLRAVALYRREVGGDVPFFRLRLEKRTPIQAGLGGGSSNAAAALYGCNALCGHRATEADLIAWSGELGSDITFFLGPTGSAYCTGRGEILEPVEPPLASPPAVLLVKPRNVGLSTPLVFKTLAAGDYATLARDRDPRDLLDAHAARGLTAPDAYVNDLEAPAFALEPALANYAMLVRNTHKLPAVTPLRAALWNSSTALAVSGDATWSM